MQHCLNLAFILDAFKPISVDCAKVVAQLGFEHTEKLDAAILQACASRAQKRVGTHHYIVQNSISENSLSYLFYPFISSVLNFKTIYIATKQDIVEQVYPHYFQLAALELEKQQSIDEMYLGFDLLPHTFSSDELKIYALCKALLDENCREVFMLGESALKPELKMQLKQWALIDLQEIALRETAHNLADINFKQLFWKRKSDESAIFCKKIAFANAPLLSQQLKVNESKAEHLIDDLLYSEHIFEKLSVFGEFTETILKHHRVSAPRSIL